MGSCKHNLWVLLMHNTAMIFFNESFAMDEIVREGYSLDKLEILNWEVI